MNRLKMIEKIFPFNNCKLCKNKRVILKKIKQEDKQINRFDSDNISEACPECMTIKNIQDNAYYSRMNKDELLFTINDYKRIPSIDSDVIEQENAIEYLNIYLNGIEKVKNTNTSIYLHSSSSSLSYLVGCVILNKFIHENSSVRIYSANKIIDTILDSFKNNGKKYNKWEDDNVIKYKDELELTDEVYFDEFEEAYKVVFVYDVPFININGATRIRFSKLLNTRKRRGGITILSSQNDFFNVIKSFPLDSHICVNLGVCDIAHQQAELLKRII